MMLLLYITVFVAAIKVGSGDVQLCKRHECVFYKVIEKRANYEVRNYDHDHTALFVTSCGLNYTMATLRNLFKIGRYQVGKNKEHIKIPTVLPLIEGYKMHGESITKDEFMMSVFLPKTIKTPPAPIEEGIHFKKAQTGYVFGVTIHGRTTYEDVAKAQKKLREDLREDGVKFIPNMFFTAVYEGSVRPELRRKEVFYLAQAN